jgi:hypothetical protein
MVLPEGVQISATITEAVATRTARETGKTTKPTAAQGAKETTIDVREE